MEKASGGGTAEVVVPAVDRVRRVWKQKWELKSYVIEVCVGLEIGNTQAIETLCCVAVNAATVFIWRKNSHALIT